MIRYLTLALTLVAAAPALAGMQGNLPTPVQKLPAYPPVVCVAPNWTTVPCASRAPKPPAVKCLRPDGTEEPCESRQATPPLTTPVVKGAIIIPSMFEGVPTIQVHGEIVSGDETKFKAAIKDLGFPSEALVYLNSIGGNLEASLAIANTVWARRYHTMVGTKAVCASMCGIIWLAGSTRWGFATSHIGFHSPYFSDKRISPGGAAVIGAFLAKLGLSDAAIRYLTEAAPNTMNWLTAEKARELGIDSRVGTQPPEARPEPMSNTFRYRTSNISNVEPDGPL